MDHGVLFLISACNDGKYFNKLGGMPIKPATCTSKGIRNAQKLVVIVALPKDII